MRKLNEGSRIVPFIEFLDNMSSSSLANFVGNNYKDIDKFRNILYTKYLDYLHDKSGSHEEFYAFLSETAYKEMGIKSRLDDFGLYGVVESRKGVKRMKRLNTNDIDSIDLDSPIMKTWFALNRDDFVKDLRKELKGVAWADKGASRDFTKTFVVEYNNFGLRLYYTFDLTDEVATIMTQDFAGSRYINNTLKTVPFDRIPFTVDGVINFIDKETRDLLKRGFNESRKGVKTMRKLNEKTFSDDDKIAVLNQFLADEEGASSEELENTRHSYGNEFESDYGDYLVVTEDEAEEEFHDSQMDLINDMGLDAFSEDFQDTILSNFSDAEDWFRDAMEETNQFYAQDIASEGSSRFDSRLVEECYDEGLIDDDDFEEDEDGEVDYYNCNYSEDELVDMYAEYLNDREGDPSNWYRMNFGDDAYQQAIIDHGDIDWDAVIDEVESWDGKANTLARYDGYEHEVKYDGEWFYIYRTN